MYNKSEIMSQAWAWFQDSSIELGEIEWVPYYETKKTFAVCLKAAWAKAKENVKEKEEYKKYAVTSEEVKAWNWAERKLNVSFDLSDEEKCELIGKEQQYFGYSRTVWACAMSAVKLYNSNNEVIKSIA